MLLPRELNSFLLWSGLRVPVSKGPFKVQVTSSILSEPPSTTEINVRRIEEHPSTDTDGVRHRFN